MNEKCKYFKDGKCHYFKDKFPENGASKLNFECENSECPITNPTIVSDYLTQNY